MEYGDVKTTLEIKDGNGDPIAEIQSWKNQVAEAVITMLKELKAEGIPITDIPGKGSITITMEKNDGK